MSYAVPVIVLDEGNRRRGRAQAGHGVVVDLNGA